MLGFDIVLDENHDLDFGEHGALRLEADVAQKVKENILFIRGEWFLDRDGGVPYFEQIFVKKPAVDRLRALYRTVILDTEGIRALRDFSLDLTAATRQMMLTFSADTDSGEIATTITI